MHEINEKLDWGFKDISDDTRMTERFYPNSLIPYSEVEVEVVNSNSKVINNSVDKSVDSLVKELEKGSTKKKNKETKAVRLQRYRNKFNRAQRKTEKTMVSKLGLYFANQLGKVLKIVKNEKTVKELNQTILLSEVLNLLNQEKKILTAGMEPIYTAGALAGSGLAIDVLGTTTTTPAANAKIVETLTNQITGINNYTYKLIKKQVAESVNAGETIAQLSKRITKVYKFNKSRSRTIARTESLKVLSQSTDAEYRKEGVTKKRWLGGTRHSHVENAGQGVVNYDFAYNGGLKFPGDSGPPSEIINCTCALAPVIV